MEPVPFLVGALAYVATGFLKSREPFDGLKALRTVGLAAVLAVMNVLVGVEVSGEDLAALLGAGEVAVAENMLKALWRRVFSTL
ncbi:MAG: hypothetical protein QXV14_06450 [Candidatus Caldarchaeum sp.]